MIFFVFLPTHRTGREQPRAGTSVRTVRSYPLGVRWRKGIRLKSRNFDLEDPHRSSVWKSRDPATGKSLRIPAEVRERVFFSVLGAVALEATRREKGYW